MADLLHYKDNASRQAIFTQMQSDFDSAHVGRGLSRISLTDKGLDTALGGGLACRRVHLITGAQASLTSGFSLAVIAMMLHAKKAEGPILWCGPLRGGRSGQLFGAGLAALGLRPEQFIFVRESHPLRRMAACEEALATKGLSAVIQEYGPLHEKADLWQKSARRLQLACEAGTATAFLLGTGGSACGFESAWQINAAMRQTATDSANAHDWRPMWQAQLRHARGGYPAAANLIWDKASASFALAENRSTHQPAQAPHNAPSPRWQERPYQVSSHSHSQSSAHAFAQPFTAGTWRKSA